MAIEKPEVFDNRSNNIDQALSDIDKKASENISTVDTSVTSAVDTTNEVDSDEKDIFAEQLLSILDNAQYDDSGFNVVRGFAEQNKARLSRNIKGLFSFVPLDSLEDTDVFVSEEETVTIDPVGSKIDLFTEPANGVPILRLGVQGAGEMALGKTFHRKVKGWPRHPDGDDFGTWDQSNWSDIVANVGIEYLGNAKFGPYEKYINMNIYDSCKIPPKIKFDFSVGDLDVILTSLKTKIADTGAGTVDMNKFVDLLDEVVVEKNPGALTVAELKVIADHLDNLYTLSQATMNYFTSAASFMSGFKDYIMKVRNVVKSNEGGMELSYQSDETAWINRLWDRHEENYKPGIIESSGFIKQDAFVVDAFIFMYKVAVKREIAVRQKFLANFFDDIKTNTLLAKGHADLLNMYNMWKDDVADMKQQFADALDEVQAENAKLIADIRADYGKVIKELKTLVKDLNKSLKASNKLLVDYGARLGTMTDAEIKRQVEEGIRLAAVGEGISNRSDELAKKTYAIDPKYYNRTLQSSIKGDIEAQKRHLTSKWKLDNASGSMKKWILGGSLTVIAGLSAAGIAVFKRKKKKKTYVGYNNGS